MHIKLSVEEYENEFSRKLVINKTKRFGGFIVKKQGNIYYGWYIVLTSAIIVLLSMGMRMGIGPFVNPVMRDLGLSRTEISIIIAIGMLVYGIGMPIAGALLTWCSTRIILLIGLFTVCVSILWTINAKGMISFLLSFGILLSLGLSFLSNITLSTIISKWFVRQRGKALFYLTTGGMAGIAVMTPVGTLLIESVGWQNTLLIFAGVFICIVIPSAIFIMKEDVPEGADGANLTSERAKLNSQQSITLKDALKTKAFWQIVMGLFSCGFIMNLLGSHGVPMLIDHGFQPTTASFGIGTIGIVAIFGTMFLGSLSDRYSRRKILFFIYFARFFGIIALVSVVLPWQLFLVTIAAGLVWAGSIATSTAILGDLYGVRLLGVLNGWAFFIGHQIGAAIGSFLGGWGYEVYGTHWFSFGLAALLSLIASFTVYLLPEKPIFTKYKTGEKNNLYTNKTQ